MLKVVYTNRRLFRGALEKLKLPKGFEFVPEKPNRWALKKNKVRIANFDANDLKFTNFNDSDSREISEQRKDCCNGW